MKTYIYNMNKIYLLILFLTLFSCKESTNKEVTTFDYGIAENGVYKNSFFNFKISYDPDWKVLSNQQEKAHTTLEENNHNHNEIIETINPEEVGTAYLFTLFKHQLNTDVEYNPSITIVAKNMNSLPEITNAAEYLAHTKKELQQSEIDYNFDESKRTKTIGNSTFSYLKSNITYSGQSIDQEFMTQLKNDFSLSFIISYTNEEQRKDLYEILNSLTIQN